MIVLKGAVKVKIIDAARYLIFLSYKNECYSLTPLKLQKVLYFAQGWSYVWDNKPLFNEKFLAWQYGPVNKDVYDTFKNYKGSELPEDEGSVPYGAKQEELDTLEAVWRRYGPESAANLVDITHSEDPWLEAYHRDKKYISNKTIGEYYQKCN